MGSSDRLSYIDLSQKVVGISESSRGQSQQAKSTCQRHNGICTGHQRRLSAKEASIRGSCFKHTAYTEVRMNDLATWSCYY